MFAMIAVLALGQYPVVTSYTTYGMGYYQPLPQHRTISPMEPSAWPGVTGRVTAVSGVNFTLDLLRSPGTKRAFRLTPKARVLHHTGRQMSVGDLVNIEGPYVNIYDESSL